MAGKSNIVCVYGALRSGTTMLRLMLDSHPKLSCPGESDVIFRYLTINGATWTLDTEALQRDWLFKTSGLTLIDGTARAQVASMIEQAGRGRERTVLMVHRDLRRVLDVQPNLQVIHMLRDPRDVARSSIGMGWAGNVYHGVGHWMKTEADWTAAAPKLTGTPCVDLRYEDLVLHPEAEIARICDFLGVTFDPAMLNYDQWSTYDKPDGALTYQWRRKLSPREVGLLEGRLGDLLEARGYAPSGHQRIRPSLTGRLALWLNNKGGIWRRRFRDYGLIDPIAVSLANRMRVPGLARRARERMDEKLIASLK